MTTTTWTRRSVNAARLQTLPEGLRGDTNLGHGAGHGEREPVKERQYWALPPQWTR